MNHNEFPQLERIDTEGNAEGRHVAEGTAEGTAKDTAEGRRAVC